MVCQCLNALRRQSSRNCGSFFLLRYRGHDAFVEARRQAVRLDIGDEPMAVFLREQGFDVLRFG